MVDFYRNESAGSGSQFARDRAPAWSDLHNGTVTALAKSRDNTSDRGLIAQKILTKPGFRWHVSMLADEG